MLVGRLILALAFFAFYSTDLFWLNLAIMFAIGAGIGAYEGVTDALLLDIHDERQNYYINVNHFFVTLGSIIIAVYLTFLSLNWRNAVIQSGVVVLILAVVYALMRVRRRHASMNPISNDCASSPATACSNRPFCCHHSDRRRRSGFGGHPHLVSRRSPRHDGSIRPKSPLILFLVGMAVGRLLVGYFSKDAQIVRTILSLVGVSIIVYSALYFLNVGQISFVMARWRGYRCLPWCRYCSRWRGNYTRPSPEPSWALSKMSLCHWAALSYLF